MKSKYRLLILIFAIAGCITAWANPLPKDKDREREPAGKVVDSGTFGVFQGGHRVGTEKFTVYQVSNGTVVQSEFKTENTPPDVQQSELQLNSGGDIRRYEWKEISPGQAESVVTPNEDFLMQKWKANPQDKDHEQPYLLPVSTIILDDYFFVHRELFAWKYLFATCKQEKGLVQCPARQRSQYGSLNPHQHSSAPLSIEFLGREKLTLKNGPQELNKLELKGEAGTWQLWLDDQFKVLRMIVVGENTEVVRD